MNIVVKERKLLSDNWYKLYKYTYDYRLKNGEWQSQKREVYDRGNGAAILLYHPKKKTVILTKQFRLPTYINGNANGMMVEVCAGLLDEENPEQCIIREAYEETGYRINKVKKIFDAYMSPGAVTEVVHFFVAEYNETMKMNEGGGIEEEQEEIEVIELDFNEAFDMTSSGQIKDARTIILLQYAMINKLV
jgi:GDP-mannose pyrophosphatase NudK